MSKVDPGVAASSQRYLTIPRTLVFITRERQEILLLRGAPTKSTWAGRYNGIGGHVERGEDVLSAAAREVREETGLTPDRLTLRGVVHVNTDEPIGILVFVFSSAYTSGELIASEEGALEWVRRDQLARLPLVPDLPALLSRILDSDPGEPPFFAHTQYDERNRLVIRFADRP